MCKLRRITHKFNIKPGGFMLNLWVIRRSLHIDKNQKIKFHSYSENFKLLVLQDKCNIEIFLSPVYKILFCFYRCSYLGLCSMVQ